jgi:hypothetical protein
MRCHHARTLMIRESREALGAEDAHGLGAHLTACGACRQWKEQLAGVSARLLRNGRPPTPTVSAARPRIGALLRGHSAGARHAASAGMPWLRPAAAALALALVAAALVHLHPGRDRGPTSSQQSAVGSRQSAVGGGEGSGTSTRSAGTRVPGVQEKPVGRNHAQRAPAAGSKEQKPSALSPQPQHPNTSTPQHPLPLPSAPSPQPADPDYLDGRDAALMAAWVTGDERDRRVRELLLRKLPPVRDDFVHIPFPLLAAADIDSRPVKDAIKKYGEEAKVVDARLFRKVTLQLKGVSLDDLCVEMGKRAEVKMQASRGVQDEKVTVFVKDRPVRDVMREVARLFGYMWARAGEPGAYRYELMQDLRAQLAEEELRLQDLNAALLALDAEMATYHPFLGLTPAQLREKAEAAKGKEQRRLWEMSFLWGGLQVYSRLTPGQIAALRAGDELWFAPEGTNVSHLIGARAEPLPKEWREPLLDALGASVVPVGPDIPRSQPPGVPPLGVEKTAQPFVGLRLDRSELGELSLVYVQGVIKKIEGREVHGGRFERKLTAPVSPATRRPENGKLNKGLRSHPLFKAETAVKPELSCPRCVAAAAGKPIPFHDALWASNSEGPFNRPHVTSADVWEAVHKATGMPIVADFYTRLHEVPSVTVAGAPLFDALCRVSDQMGARWRRDGDFLLARSTSFFWDKLKEVPNRHLQRWAAIRRERGGLPLEEVLDLVMLSDRQLDSEAVGTAVVHCWGIEEWGLMGSKVRPMGRAGMVGRDLRPYYRLAAGLTHAQLQDALKPDGLPWASLSPAQQQAFARTDQSLAGTTTRVRFAPSGWYVWQTGFDPGTPPEQVWRLPLVAEPTAEQALAAARRLDPHASPEEIQRYSGLLAVSFIGPGGLPVRDTGRPPIMRRGEGYPAPALQR